MLCKHIVDNIKGIYGVILKSACIYILYQLPNNMVRVISHRLNSLRKSLMKSSPPDEELLDNMQLADLQRVLQSASSDSAQARYKILITSYFVSNHLTSGQQSRVLDVLKQLALIDTNNSWTTPDNDRPTLLWDINGI